MNQTVLNTNIEPIKTVKTPSNIKKRHLSKINNDVSCPCYGSCLELGDPRCELCLLSKKEGSP